VKYLDTRLKKPAVKQGIDLLREGEKKNKKVGAFRELNSGPLAP
jgi:hypothetical protein